MKNNTFFALKLYGYRSHQSLAESLPIARIYINMLAPKAIRTVVGVTIAFYD